MTSNVDNSFAQPVGGGTDNVLTLGGTSTVSGTQAISGTQNITGSVDVKSGGSINVESGGTLAVAGAQTVAGTVVTGTAQSLKSKTFTTTIDDISTGPTSFWIIPGVAGTITKISSVLYGAIANVDAIITAEIVGTPVTDSALTIAFSGSAAGDVDSSAPSAANVITASQAVEIITNGASTNAIRVDVTIEIQLA